MTALQQAQVTHKKTNKSELICKCRPGEKFESKDGIEQVHSGIECPFKEANKVQNYLIER